MNDELKQKLIGLGLTDEQAARLQEQGVAGEEDLRLLTRTEIKDITGCGLVTAAKVEKAFAPEPVATPASAATVVDPNAEIPEGKNLSQADITGFASAIGADPSTLMMLMFGGNMAAGGMGEFDISSMIPIPNVVAGYNPKVRNMFLMVMGQMEARLGVPIVVIDEDGAVNRGLTVEYIEGLEEGRDAAEDNIYFDTDGMPHEVILVGVDAQSIYDADPLEPSKALQKNGMGTGRVNWHGVELAVKQVAFYAVRTREINPKDDADLTWLRDKISPTARRLVFTGKAPKAISAYNEAMRTGELPMLRVMLTRAPRRREVMPRRRPGSPRDLSGIGRDGGGEL